MTVAKKRCLCCKEYFPSESMVKYPIGMFCTQDHAIKYAMEKELKNKAKKERKETVHAKEKLKTMSDYRKEAQNSVNRYIRARDYGKPCRSCGKEDNGSHQRHAGHYLSRGAHPELSYNVLNIHIQCATCNVYLSGNLLEYRKGLINSYGKWIIDYLESHHELKKYTKDDLKRIKRTFNKRALFYEKRNRR